MFLLTADARGRAGEAALAAVVTAVLSPIYLLLAVHGRRTKPAPDRKRRRRRALAISGFGFAVGVALILFGDGLGPAFFQVGVFFAIVAWLHDARRS